MFKLPWGKKTKGHYRSAKEKVQETKYKVDQLLLQAWYQDLREHPQFLREIARQKFGLSPEPEGFGGEGSTDLLDVLRQAREAKDLIKDELGEKSNFWQTLPDLIKALPTLVQGLQTIQGQPQPVTQQLKQPEPPKPPELSSEQQRLKDFATQLLEMSPEEAVFELASHRTEEGTIHCLIFNTLVSSSVDDIIALIPTLTEVPEYQFLMPLAQRLTTTKGKQWLALLIDEIRRLESGETEPKLEETE